MINKALFSSKSEEWSTPQKLFDELNAKYHFTLDPCATTKNTKCKTFFTKKENGLKADWGGYCVFCNPPYGRAIKDWVKKCYDESRRTDVATRIVLLIPARTDTAYFHDYIYKKKGVSIEFLKGRLKFGNSKNSAPFPSMIVIFN